MKILHLSLWSAIGLAAALFSASGSNAGYLEVSGSARIVDGDTLEVGDTTIRLHGIDAAETGQRCVSKDKHIVRPGDMAEKRLADLASKGIACAGDSHDDYGRLIAHCKSSGGTDINAALVTEGLAWAYVKYSADYVEDEATAKQAGLGIWSMRCEEPWTFRAKRWEVAVQKAPNGCPIKGNISERGRIYHTPWSRHYAGTKVSLDHGERWFCSEKEALDAGWRAPIK